MPEGLKEAARPHAAPEETERQRDRERGKDMQTGALRDQWRSPTPFPTHVRPHSARTRTSRCTSPVVDETFSTSLLSCGEMGVAGDD